MPRIQLSVLAALTISLIASVAPAAPLTIPLSAVGINQSIVVSSHDIAVINGGLFSGTIAGNPADLWCIDAENYVNPPQSYQGNVTLLGAWAGGVNSEVQKGTATGSAWVYPGVPALTPLQRYQAAAYLITQMQAFQSGADVSTDDPYQSAIWSLLDLGPTDNVSESAQALIYRSDAISHILSNQSFGFGTWAVVSGTVDANGGLAREKVQTFLTPVASQVPEPGTYALMGAGLLGLATISRRKRS